MLTLGLDTTTGWGCLGLFQDGTAVAETVWRVGKNQAEQFLPVLAEMMARAGLAPSALDLIAVGCGPGSYTGLRIGIAMAEALSFTLDRPVTGVCTLAALAENAPDFPGPVCASVVARRGEVYAAVYRAGREISPPSPKPPASLLLELAALGEERILALGSGAGLLRAAPLPPGLELVYGHPEQDLVRGITVARLGAVRPVARPYPIYLRRTEAEERLVSGV
ncbi:MAG: tRNA (adenosine(37)-N6)-threonylcarbamoyltransferase complex dimerization subunit type 1 TsaB [Bacteroidota bacterium]